MSWVTSNNAQNSAAAAAAAAPTQRRITEVHLDGVAVLKIIKHCKDALPDMVAGSLLGLDTNGILEVTNTFPFPQKKSDAEASASRGIVEEGEAADLTDEEYRTEMMRMLREVNVDNNCVGWYKTMYLGSFCTTDLVETQFTYQKQLSPNAIVLLYDPKQTANGNLTIKAFRLSEKFLAAHTAGTNEFIKPSEILEELPIKIRNSGLINALVYDLRDALPESTPFDQLDLSTNPYLERHLERLCRWVDDLAEEQAKFQYYTRAVARAKQEQARWAAKRRAGDEEDDAEEPPEVQKPPSPQFLDSLLIGRQIEQYCTQINQYTGKSFQKLFTVSGLVQSQ